MRVFAICVVAAAILTPAAAFAAQPGYDCRALDLNGDRLIQRSEFNKVANADRSAAGGGSAEAAAPAFRRADRNDSATSASVSCGVFRSRKAAAGSRWTRTATGESPLRSSNRCGSEG